MDTYVPQYYDLLSRAFGGDVTSARLQAFIDDTLALKYNKLQLPGFTFNDDMQLDFTYEQLQREVGITAMANYYDLDSPAKPRPDESVTLSTGKIPRMKDVIYFNEDKIRRQMIVEKMLDAHAATLKAGAKLFSTVDTLVGGHTNSLTYQRHQMVSRGKLTLDSANNPLGIQGVTFSAHIPGKNVTTLSGTARFWTDKGTYKTVGDDADPVASIIDWLQPIYDLGIPGHIEVNKAYLRRVLNHPAVVKSIGFSLFPTASSEVAQGAASVLSFEEKRRVLAERVGCPIDAIDSVVAVKKYDKAARAFETVTANAFEPDVLVFVPDGTIGEVITVMPLPVEDRSAVNATYYGGKLLLTVCMDAQYKCQAFHTEMTSLAVPNVPQRMFYLYPNEG